MSEKMLVTQALDERDLLVKKIENKIAKLKVVDTKKRNEEKTANARMTAEEFGKSALSAYQQIMDLIDRYQRIDAALVSSNAETKICTSYGDFTVSEAISLKNRLKKNGIYSDLGAFEDRLICQMELQYQTSIREAEAKNKCLEMQAETMRLSILGKDSKVKDDKPLEVVDAYIRENTMEVIDLLDVCKKAEELRCKMSTLLTELETQIKVSNATTTIEF